MNLHHFQQPLFAARTWLPLLLGTVIASSVDIQSRVFRWSCLALWAITIGGIFLTWKWHAPWVGFDYEVGGVKLDASREWTIGGIDRLAGFSRSSFDAALQCLFLAVLAVIGCRYYVVSLGIWIISGAAIYLTTSRSAAAALVVAMGLHILVAFNRTSPVACQAGRHPRRPHPGGAPVRGIPVLQEQGGELRTPRPSPPPRRSPSARPRPGRTRSSSRSTGETGSSAAVSGASAWRRSSSSRRTTIPGTTSSSTSGWPLASSASGSSDSSCS